ncbi:uncharacterized protein LOC110976207 [Acanthaster planci]|uniref:Uncharacterized protein LOC110976207 n=1 Tax=Acanthaster planci TaxID=133434 RepID=A0A8B7XVT8_ACAPL|nr:uncharacterized protein LOC110976207 [Acanthaster planci]
MNDDCHLNVDAMAERFGQVESEKQPTANNDRPKVTCLDTLMETLVHCELPRRISGESNQSASNKFVVNCTGTVANSKRRCVVCKGLATGYHYGVASCEACKAFFKRSVQKKLTYLCLEKRQCEVSHGNRRTCQACRYTKCIKAGMLVDGVRKNRSKGGRQEYRRKPDEKDFSPSTSGKKRKYKIALEFSKRLLEIEPEALKISVADDLKACFCSGDKTKYVTGMQILAELADRALLTTVRWAKKIPDFDKLCLSDQMALLSNSWMEILLLNVIYRNAVLPAPSEGGGIVVLANGLKVYREDIGQGKSSPLIFEQIMNLVDRMRPLRLSKAVIVILKVMVLFNAGPSLSNRLPLKSHKELLEMHATVHDALHYRIQQEHSGNARLVYHLMMILPLIKDTALTITSLIWGGFFRERVPMQQLLKEVLQPILQAGERNCPATVSPAHHDDRAETSSAVPGRPSDTSIYERHFVDNSEPREAGYPRSQLSPDSFVPKLCLNEKSVIGGKDSDAAALPRRLCAVCEGFATGYHYGVASCEACKAFFKRTVQRNLCYSCSEDGRCDVFHGKRRTCQACRYDKCIQVGMMVSGVRLNRTKGGRQEYRRRPDELGFTSVNSGKNQRRARDEMSDFCKTLLEIEPGVLHIILPDASSDGLDQYHAAGGRPPIQKLWMERLAEAADRALTNTVQWAKKVPGFDKLCLNDQMALLCNSWMEILLANVIYRSTQIPPYGDNSTMIYFADGFVVTKEMCHGTRRAPLIYSQIVNIVERLRELNISRVIMVLLKAAILLNSGPSLANRISLQSPREVRQLQETVYTELHYRINQEHPGDSRLVYHLLMILPLIKDVAVTVASLVWIEFNQEHVFMQELLNAMVRPIIQTKSHQVVPCCCNHEGCKDHIEKYSGRVYEDGTEDDT